MIWDNKNIPSGVAPTVSRIIRDPATHYIYKADILRYEILRLYGGFYADFDTELLKSLEGLRDHDFVCGMESPDNIGNAFLGCCANNNVIEGICKNAVSKYNNVTAKQRNTEVLDSTGPYEMTRYIRGSHKQVVPFGQEYFAPVDWCKNGEVTELTYVTHHYDGRWTDKYKQKEYTI